MDLPFSSRGWNTTLLEKYKGYDRSLKQGGLVAQQDEDSTHEDSSSHVY